MAKSDDQTAEVAGVRLTHPGRVLYPDQGLTKLDLARYYQAVAGRLLPHLRDRPLSLVRCPSGRATECFYQKHLGAGFPRSVRRVRIREKDGGTGAYGVANSLAAVVALVQMGVLEIHAWGARRDRLERPDRLIFDLDPDEGLPWERVAAAAFELRDRLAELGLRSFLKTTGGKGLHLVVPLLRRHRWDEIHAFGAAVAADLVRRRGEAYVSTAAKEKRRGKIFLDYLRNTRGATAVAPYSTRARPGAPVSTPLAWDELTPDLRSDRYTVANLPTRLAALASDPWEGFGAVRQSITRAMTREVGLAAARGRNPAS
jgi:bifunctional non-homologous end joining protein LigD